MRYMDIAFSSAIEIDRQMKKIFKNIKPVLLSLVVLGAGCSKDYLVTNPTDAVSGETVFETTEGAYVALDGTYRTNFNSLTDHGNFGQKAYDLTSDLMGLDMVVHKQGYNWFNGEYQFTAIATSSTNSRSDRTWYHYYRMINNANRIIALIDGATGPQEDKDNIKGQALAIRAHSYFYLINFFQHTYKGNENKPGVPLYTEPTSEGVGRGTVQQVYDQIVADLSEAQTLLDGKPRRHATHIDARTVHAIRALVALQMEDYETAKTQAAAAREGLALGTPAQYTGGTMFNTVDGPEYIWGAQIINEQATIFASFYSHMDAASGGYATLGTNKKISKYLYDLIPEGDVRKENFTKREDANATFPFLNQTKIRLKSPGDWAGDYIFFRASEQYLIEAEASARLGDEANAISVLESLVKARYPDYSASGLSGQALIDEILIQRRIELWGEGRSLLDIKRLKTGLNRPTGDGNHNGWDMMSETNKASNFSIPQSALVKPDQDPTFLFRIPQDEINANAALTDADQNP